MPVVRVDPVQLKQAFLNLVVNSCDGMADNKPAIKA